MFFHITEQMIVSWGQIRKQMSSSNPQSHLAATESNDLCSGGFWWNETTFFSFLGCFVLIALCNCLRMLISYPPLMPTPFEDSLETQCLMHAHKTGTITFYEDGTKGAGEDGSFHCMGYRFVSGPMWSIERSSWVGKHSAESVSNDITFFRDVISLLRFWSGVQKTHNILMAIFSLVNLTNRQFELDSPISHFVPTSITPQRALHITHIRALPLSLFKDSSGAWLHQTHSFAEIIKHQF